VDNGEPGANDTACFEIYSAANTPNFTSNPTCDTLHSTGPGDHSRPPVDEIDLREYPGSPRSALARRMQKSGRAILPVPPASAHGLFLSFEKQVR
jgi:hypothetical protein